MTIGDKMLFQLTQGGVSADVYLEELVDGQTQVKIVATHGTLDLNAIFWNIVGGDNSLAGVSGLTSSLNMNGVGTPAGVQWDDAQVLSQPGSHTIQITAGGNDTFVLPNLLNVSVEDFLSFGIRAGGNKMVDTSGEFTSAPDPNTAPIATDDFSQMFDEGKATKKANLLGNDSDPDGDQLHITKVMWDDASGHHEQSLVDGGTNFATDNGQVVITSGGGFSVHYTGPDLHDGQIRHVLFSYEITDDKGGFDQADVDITVNGVDNFHDGDFSFGWDFELHTQALGDEVGIPQGFWDLSQFVKDHPSGSVYELTGETLQWGEDPGTQFASYTQVHGVDGNRALDTAASPGNIFLQAIPEGRGGAAATMPDLVAGQTYHAEIMVLRQEYLGQPFPGTDPNASVDFNFNGTILNVKASDIGTANEFVKFDIYFDGKAGEDSFTIMSHGTDQNPQGLLIDSITVHDWII